MKDEKINEVNYQDKLKNAFSKYDNQEYSNNDNFVILVVIDYGNVKVCAKLDAYRDVILLKKYNINCNE